QEPSPRVPFKGSATRIRAVRCALARGLGYTRFRDDGIGLLTRLRARTLLRRLRWSCPPWVGAGRYLDVGCGSGAGLGVARPLSHFTPETLERTVRTAGGRVIWCWHQAKPRYYLRSLSNFLHDRGSQTLAEFVEWRPASGVLKLFLELTLPLVSLAGRGEVIRIGAARN